MRDCGARKSLARKNRIKVVQKAKGRFERQLEQVIAHTLFCVVRGEGACESLMGDMSDQLRDITQYEQDRPNVAQNRSSQPQTHLHPWGVTALAQTETGS